MLVSGGDNAKRMDMRAAYIRGYGVSVRVVNGVRDGDKKALCCYDRLSHLDYRQLEIFLVLPVLIAYILSRSPMVTFLAYVHLLLTVLTSMWQRYPVGRTPSQPSVQERLSLNITSICNDESAELSR